MAPANLLQLSNGRAKRTNANEEFDHCQLSNAPPLTIPPAPEFIFMDQYPIFWDVLCFSRMRTSCNELPVWDRFDTCHEMAVAGWPKR